MPFLLLVLYLKDIGLGLSWFRLGGLSSAGLWLAWVGLCWGLGRGWVWAGLDLGAWRTEMGWGLAGWAGLVWAGGWAGLAHV